jgi:hypothetical protein
MKQQVPGPSTMEDLEGCIDAFGLFETLVAISVICNDKAAHIKITYEQSGKLAMAWRHASNAVERAALSASVQMVSP